MYQGQDTLHYAIGRAGRLCTSITSCRTHFPRSSQLMYRIGASPNLHVFLAPHGACGEDLAFTLNPVAGKVGGGRPLAMEWPAPIYPRTRVVCRHRCQNFRVRRSERYLRLRSSHWQARG